MKMRIGLQAGMPALPGLFPQQDHNEATELETRSQIARIHQAG